jgi:hypothetical protein
MGVTSQPFLGRKRRTFLGLDDLAQYEDIINPAMAQRPKPRPEENYVEALPEEEAPEETMQSVIHDVETAKERPSKMQMAIAEQLLQRGEQPIQQGAGWVGGLDKLAASIGGAYMARKAEEDQLAYEQKQAQAMADSLSGILGGEDARSRYIKAIAKTDPKRAQAMLDRLATEKPTEVRRISRDRADGNRTYQEESFDGGKTWKQYGQKVDTSGSGGGENRPPNGFRWGPPDEAGNPTLIGITGGPGDQNLKPDTEIQGKSFAFGTRMAQTIPQLSDPEIISALMNPTNVAWSEWTPEIISNYRVSSKFRNGMQAVRNFINAQLRKESGAAIGRDEFDNAFRQYIPRPGDDAATLRQKENNRRVAIYSMFIEAGPKYKKLADRFTPEGLVTDPATKTPGVRDVAPSGAALPSGPAAPAARPKPKVGDTRPDPRTGKLRVWDGNNWVIKK